MQQDAGNINILLVRSLRKARVEATHRLQSRMDFCLFLDNVSPPSEMLIEMSLQICLFGIFLRVFSKLMSVIAQLLRFVCFVRFVGKITSQMRIF